MIFKEVSVPLYSTLRASDKVVLQVKLSLISMYMYMYLAFVGSAATTEAIYGETEPIH